MWEYGEGHAVKTDEEAQNIRQVAKHRRQTAELLCQQMRAKRVLVRHELSKLAEQRRRLKESLDQLRKMRRAFHYTHGQKRDREVAALVNILRSMPLSSQS
jgi:hypothetical protein